MSEDTIGIPESAVTNGMVNVSKGSSVTPTRLPRLTSKLINFPS